jgi:hypothetical protein
MAQVGLKLTVFLLQPAECWDYSHVPPYPAYFICSFFGA